ncbi:hypothetical protein A4U61_32815 [Streptomyces sp. H-KF8]|nr:hypothetical protein A4U61_32815 [Streptomyces sp. H-KF8]
MQTQQYVVVVDEAIGVRQGAGQELGQFVAGGVDVDVVQSDPQVQRAVLNGQFDVHRSTHGVGRLTAPGQRLVQRAEVDGQRQEGLLPHVVADRDAGAWRLVTGLGDHSGTPRSAYVHVDRFGRVPAGRVFTSRTVRPAGGTRPPGAGGRPGTDTDGLMEFRGRRCLPVIRDRLIRRVVVARVDLPASRLSGAFC